MKRGWTSRDDDRDSDDDVLNAMMDEMEGRRSVSTSSNPSTSARAVSPICVDVDTGQGGGRAKGSVHHLYVLELQNHHWYVGTTTNLKKRLIQHMSGKGSEWTKRYPPVGDRFSSTEEMSNETEARTREDAKVVELMTKYPIHHVRGGSYSMIDMDRDTVKRLMPQLHHAKNLCMRCGRRDHWSKSCDADEDVFGNRLEEPRRHHDYASGSGANRRASTGGNVHCYKCKGFGHYANACPVQTTRGPAFASVSSRASSGKRVTCLDVPGNPHEEAPRRHQDYASGSGANRRASTGGNVHCYKCKGFGHYANACPVQTTRGPAFASVSSRASSGVQLRCFTCNRLGHIATACPSRNPGRAGSGARVFSGGLSHSGSEEEECSDDGGSDDSYE